MIENDASLALGPYPWRIWLRMYYLQWIDDQISPQYGFPNHDDLECAIKGDVLIFTDGVRTSTMGL